MIQPDLPKAEFARILQERIETATDRLIAEALAKDPGLAVNLAKADQKTSLETAKAD